MKPAPSLQRRLDIGLAIGVTILWLAANMAAALVVHHELSEAYDSALQETAQRILPLAVSDIFRHGRQGPTRHASILEEHDEYLTYVVRTTKGRVLLKSHDIKHTTFPERPRLGFYEFASHRVYGEAAPAAGLVIEVAELLSHRIEATYEAVIALLLPLLFLIPLSMAGVWWFVRRSMRPVLAFKGEIERRDGSDLSTAAAEDVPAEIKPIAVAVNQLIQRLPRAIEAERSFTANSAHELRSPIALMLAQTQRLIAESPKGPPGDRARQIENALQRLARLSEKLMQLAKAEGGGLLSETPQDIAHLLPHITREFEHELEEPDRLQLTLPEDTKATSRIDPDAFAILLRNLIENAIKHGDLAEPVTVRLTSGRTLHVVNAGPVVPPDELARLRGRFERGATAAEGAGLGLAIAEAITAGIGAWLDLLSPATGRTDGFEAILHLPE